MADPTDSRPLPISWDEAREVVIVVLLAVAAMHVLAPVVGFRDNPFRGRSSVIDHVVELTQNAGPNAGMLVLAAAVLVVTTPPGDVIPVLRRAAAVVALLVAVAAAVHLIATLTRSGPSGLAARLQVIFGRSGPGLLLASTARWLSTRVVAFGD